MTKQITTTVYTFDELSDDAKKRALDDNRYIHTEYFDWWHADYDYWTEKLNELGYTDVNIEFSGFYSQGDGANFTAQIDLRKWLTAYNKLNANKALLEAVEEEGTGIAISRSGHYAHEYAMDIDSDSYTLDEEQTSKLASLCDEILKEARVLAKEIYSDLQSTYELATSDETIAEFLIDTEHLFLVDGKEPQL